MNKPIATRTFYMNQSATCTEKRRCSHGGMVAPGTNLRYIFFFFFNTATNYYYYYYYYRKNNIIAKWRERPSRPANKMASVRLLKRCQVWPSTFGGVTGGDGGREEGSYILKFPPIYLLIYLLFCPFNQLISVFQMVT